jgi:NADPH2 dehydrogenase
LNGLFSPLDINNLALKNRLVMPPMALDIATEKGEVTDKLMEHYRSRAVSSSRESGNKTAAGSRAGVGLIIVEHSYVSPGGRAHPCQLGIYTDFLIPRLKVLADEIHRFGLSIGIQISHAGARALSAPSAPSGFYCPYLGRYGRAQTEEPELPHELSVAEINRIVIKFQEAALRALRAGFDLIEIHGAHGYLLNQFYSPLTNRRSDQYGGTLERRLRFPLEVIEAVRAAVGKKMPTFYRLGADDRLPGGTTPEDSKKALSYFQEAGVDCLDLSGGICGYLKNGPEGFFNYLAEELKPLAQIPVMVTGGIRDPVMADRFIAAGKADLVGIGRALLADPLWACRAWERINESIRKDDL